MVHPLSEAMMAATNSVEARAAMEAAGRYLQQNTDQEMTSLMEMCRKRLEAWGEPVEVSAVSALEGKLRG